jgi:hypothetical protein
MASFFESLRERLASDELAAIEPLFSVQLERFDAAVTTVRSSAGFWQVVLGASGDLCCPFELHFGRGDNARRFNFFVGLGTEFYNYELIDDGGGPAEIADDLGRFLRSRVGWERLTANGAVVRVAYALSELVIDGVPAKLWYRKSATRFFARRRKWVSMRPGSEAETSEHAGTRARSSRPPPASTWPRRATTQKLGPLVRSHPPAGQSACEEFRCEA